MSREKQIDEMAIEILEEFTNCYSQADEEHLARMLKHFASEVAAEIIADLVKFADDKERQMSFHGHSVWYIDADDVTDFIAELKKKYTEGGE
jgi:hypothetical protein